MHESQVDKLQYYLHKKLNSIVTGERVKATFNVSKLDKEVEELKRKANAFDEISNVVKGYEHHLKPHDSFDHKDSNEVLDIVLDVEREDTRNE